MSVVSDIQDEFRKRNIQADWINTGGGCMALSVLFGENVADDPQLRRYEVLITERDDNFYGRPDKISADEVQGFFAGLYVSDDNGERLYDECVSLYRSSEELVSVQAVADDIEENGESTFPPGTFPADIPAEVVAVADHVEFVLRAIESAEFAAFVNGERSVSQSRHRMPDVVHTVRTNGVGGQLMVTAYVRYGDASPAAYKFVGSTYGGPVVLVQPSGEQIVVSDPSRFGEFGEQWVRNFYGV